MTTATRASDFLRSIGAATHIAYTDGGYADVSAAIADLRYLGITHVRDGLSDGEWGSAPLSSYIAVARAGITFTVVIDSGLVKTTADLSRQLSRIKTLLAAVPGAVTAIEGPNEINNGPVTYNGVTGLDGALALQRDLYAAVHADPALTGVQVAYFTGYAAGGVGVGPNPATTPGLADADTQHPYPNYGQAPAAWVDPARALPNQPPGSHGPFVYTETGYSSKGGTGGAVNLDVQARYTLDLLLDAFKAGAKETDLYELMDAYAAGSPQGNDGWGLFGYGNAAKPVAQAIHTLTAILQDGSGSARTFAPATLTPTLRGLPATGTSLVLQKSNGTYDVVVWAEPSIWDQRTGTELAAAPSTVTVDLGATFDTVSVYDPLAGGAPQQVLHGVGTVGIAVVDHPVIIEAVGRNRPPAPAVDTLTLMLSEDAYKGDAQFSVAVDGRTVGGVGTVTALHRLGQSQAFTVTGSFGAGPHTVGITFLNDLWEGSAATDRNLHVDSLSFDGALTPVDRTQARGGLALYAVDGGGGLPSKGAAPTGPDTLTLLLSEDAYQGDAQFAVTVDGKAVGGVGTVTALHRLGQSQAFAFSGSFGAGRHTVGIDFLNDRFGGTASTDRNLHVDSIALNGTTTAIGHGQFVAGLALYQIGQAAA